MLPPPSYKEHLGFYTSQSSARLDAAIQSAIQTGAPYELDLEMVRADGAIRSVTGRGEVERDADGQVVLVRGTVQDVTERKQAENEIRLLARLQAVLADIGQQALRSGGPARCWTRPSLWWRRLSTSSIARCWSFFRTAKLCSFDPASAGRKGWSARHRRSGTDSQAGYTLLSDQPVIVEDLRTEQRFSGPPLLHEHGVVSGMSVVIPTSEGPYGVLGAHTTQRRSFTKDEVNFLAGGGQCPGNHD